MVAKRISPLLVIVGETASGKSALAMDIAEQYNGEIIAADSWTVYKGFDIGTAKPTPEERARIPHHLIDIADPRQGFSAALFKAAAVKAIEEIRVRGKLPILVGGTGLYIDSVIFDYDFLPAPSDRLRQQLNALSLEALQRLAEERGLDTNSIDVQNKRRIIRLIENDGKLPVKRELRPNILILGMYIPPEQLKNKIERRIESMIEKGLESEVSRLAALYGWEVEPMKGIGYREWREYFEGTQSLERTKERIVTATNGLAKRQRTWFKRNKSIQWIDDRSKAVEIITAFLNK